MIEFRRMLVVVMGGVLFISSCTCCPNQGGRPQSETTSTADAAAADPPAAGPGITAGPRQQQASINVYTSRRTYCLVVSPPPAEFPVNQMFSVHVSVLDGAKMTPIRDADMTLTLDAAMPAHHHGMKTLPKATRNPDGSFTIRGVLLHMAGDWELYLDVARDGMIERAQISVTLE